MEAHRRLIGSAALALAVAVAGCGGGGERTATQATSPPLGRAPSAPAPPTQAAPSTVMVPKPRGGGAVPGGQRAVRVPATFTLRGSRLSPRVVAIPPFLAARVSVAATDGRAHAVFIRADRTYRLSVPAGKRASFVLPGQRPGRYAIVAGSARATLAVGTENG